MNIEQREIFNKYDMYLKNIKVPILISLNNNKHMSIEAKKVLEAIINDDIISSRLEILGKHDKYTKTHSINVGILSFFLAFNRNYNTEELITIVKGALLHDIGKSKIPLEILNKPGRLTPEEFTKIQNHSERGYEMIKNEDISDEIKNIVLYHHARLDGSGYPKLKEGDILKENIQIVSLCDVFDALIGDRIYKPGMSKLSAYRIIHSEMSGKLNTELLDCLIENVSIFDVGETALLNTKEKCVVVALNTEDLNRPIVRIVSGENEGKVIDLNVDRNFNLIYT